MCAWKHFCCSKRVVLPNGRGMSTVFRPRPRVRIRLDADWLIGDLAHVKVTAPWRGGGGLTGLLCGFSITTPEYDLASKAFLYDSSINRRIPQRQKVSMLPMLSIYFVGSKSWRHTLQIRRSRFLKRALLHRVLQATRSSLGTNVVEAIPPVFLNASAHST